MNERLKIENESVAYEKRDVNVRVILWTGVIIIISAILIHAAVWWLFTTFNRQEAHKARPPATLVNVRRQPPPEPRLQADPPADLNQMRAVENSELHTYAWIDRQKGRVRIPIEQAMRLVAQRGLPDNQQPSSNANASRSAQSSAGSNEVKKQGESRANAR